LIKQRWARRDARAGGGNHHARYDILVKTLPEYKFTDQDIKNRYVGFYVDERIFTSNITLFQKMKKNQNL
jgi:hypothetical protein